MPIFGAAYAAPNKGKTLLYWLKSLSTVLSPTENSRIQAFELFSIPFQGRFNFQVLLNPSTFPACVTPVSGEREALNRVGSHVVFAFFRIHCTDRRLYTIFQPTFFPIKLYQDSIFKLLTLSTNSVTNVVRTAYFQIQARSSPLKICDRVCTQSKKLNEDILASLDREK